jgi:hypothetical protein
MSSRPLDAFVGAAIIFVQVICGLAALSFANLPKQVGTLTVFGAAAAAGSVLLTLIDQVAIASFGHLPAVAFWCIAGVSLVLVVKRFSFVSTMYADDLYVGALCFLAMFLGLSQSNPAAIVASATLGLVFVVFRGLRQRPNFGHALLGLILVEATFVSAQRVFNGSQSFWWALNRGSDDQIYSESLSWSISRSGPLTNPLAAGIELNYHWFSFAWSGMTSRLGGFEPFFVTLHLVNPLGLFATASILILILHQLKIGRIGVALTIVIAFATSTFPEPTRLAYVLNTSNVVSHLWFALTIWFVVRYLQNSTLSNGVVVVAGTVITFLAKIPYATSILAGLSLVVLVAGFSREHFGRHLMMTVGSFSGCAVAYVAFISPPDWRSAGFRLGNSVGELLTNSTRPLEFFLIVVALVIMHSWLIAPGLTSLAKNHLHDNVHVFLIGAALIGLLRFLVDGATSENYFLSAAILPIAILAATSEDAVEQLVDQNQLLRTSLFLGAIIVFVGGMIIAFDRYFTTQSSEWKLFVLSSLSLGALMAVGYPVLRNHPTQKRAFVLLACVAIGVAQFAGSLATSDLARLSPDRTYVSTSHIEGLSWLRENARNDDIVATNFSLCRKGSTCVAETARSTVSAFSQLVTFAEGPRSIVGAGPNSSGGRPYPGWLEQRIELSLDAIEAPTADRLSRLRCDGVAYLAVMNSNPSTPIERIDGTDLMFSNDEISILRLKEPSDSKTCSAN